MNNDNFENKAKALNDELFSSNGTGTVPSPVQGAPAKKKKEFDVKGFWLSIAITLLTLVIAFTGSFLGIKYVCQTALFGDSEFMENFLAKFAGVEENKIVVDTISGQYVGSKMELAEKALESTVSIRVVTEVDGGYVSVGSGSGVIIEYFEDSGVTYVVTNWHVVSDNPTFFIETYDGKRYLGEVFHLDEISDLAIVKFVSEKKRTPITFADSDKAVAGQDLIAAGNPRGLGFSVSFGYVSHPYRDKGEIGGGYIQMDISVNPGSSGGGVFDAQGNLIGIVVSKEVGDNVDGIGYAIPSNRVIKVVSDLLKFGYVKGRAALGISAYTVTSTNYTALANSDLKGYLPLNGDRKYGLYINESTRSQELKKGDRIVSADGMSVLIISDLREAIAKHPPYSTMTVKVERIVDISAEIPTYETHEITVLLGERDWPDEPVS